MEAAGAGVGLSGVGVELGFGATRSADATVAGVCCGRAGATGSTGFGCGPVGRLAASSAASNCWVAAAANSSARRPWASANAAVACPPARRLASSAARAASMVLRITSDCCAAERCLSASESGAAGGAASVAPRVAGGSGVTPIVDGGRLLFASADAGGVGAGVIGSLPAEVTAPGLAGPPPEAEPDATGASVGGLASGATPRGVPTGGLIERSADPAGARVPGLVGSGEPSAQVLAGCRP